MCSVCHVVNIEKMVDNIIIIIITIMTIFIIILDWNYNTLKWKQKDHVETESEAWRQEVNLLRSQFLNSWTGSGSKVSWFFLPKPFLSWQVAFLCNMSEVFHSEEQHLEGSKVTQMCPTLCNPLDCM